MTTVREQLKAVFEVVPDLPDRLICQGLRMADEIDKNPSAMFVVFITTLLNLDRRLGMLETGDLDYRREFQLIHDEFQWLDSHLATLLPGAYGLDEEDEDDEDA